MQGGTANVCLPGAEPGALPTPDSFDSVKMEQQPPNSHLSDSASHHLFAERSYRSASARSSFESVIESFHKSEKSDPLKNGTLEKVSSKLLDKGASRRQIGKAPAIMDFAPSNNSSSMSRLDVSQLMKLCDPAAQSKIQFVGANGKFDDIGVVTLVG
jgi:hypothetical protein